MELVTECYRVTAAWPRQEMYGLTSQLRRAATSIPSNIAEGHCRRTTGAFANHVSIALGSHGELETCLEVALRLGYLARGSHESLRRRSDSVGRLLNGLYGSLERKLRNSRLNS